MEINMYAYDVRPGDYLYVEKENGRSSGGSRYVMAVAGNDDTVTVTLSGIQERIDFTMDANTPVTVERG